MLLFIASIFVQVIAVLVALYYVVPLGWLAALLRYAYRTSLRRSCFKFVMVVICCSLMQSIKLYFFGASTLSVNVRGIEICYLIRKSGTSSTPSGPTAVFIHGATSNKHTFYSVWKCLPKSWTLVALDLPGHGESTFSMEQSYTHVEMEGFLHEVCVRLLA